MCCFGAARQFSICATTNNLIQTEPITQKKLNGNQSTLQSWQYKSGIQPWGNPSDQVKTHEITSLPGGEILPTRWGFQIPITVFLRCSSAQALQALLLLHPGVHACPPRAQVRSSSSSDLGAFPAASIQGRLWAHPAGINSRSFFS